MSLVKRNHKIIFKRDDFDKGKVHPFHSFCLFFKNLDTTTDTLSSFLVYGTFDLERSCESSSVSIDSVLRLLHSKEFFIISAFKQYNAILSNIKEIFVKLVFFETIFSIFRDFAPIDFFRQFSGTRAIFCKTIHALACPKFFIFCLLRDVPPPGNLY